MVFPLPTTTVSTWDRQSNSSSDNIMSRANAPGGEVDTVYDEVDEPTAGEFSMDENVCYGDGDIKSDSTDKQFSHRMDAAKVFLVLIVLVIALLLGTVCAFIAIAVEISNLKSELASSQMATASNAENLTQQIALVSFQLNEKIQYLNASIDLTLHQFSQDHFTADNTIQQLNVSTQQLKVLTQQLNEEIQYLNTSIDSSVQQFSRDHFALDNKILQLNASTQRLTQQLNENIQNFNTSIDSFLQQFSRDHSTLDNKIQQLNASTQQITQQLTSTQHVTQELNASVTLFNQQHSQSHITLDEKIELLNSSIYSSQEQLRRLDNRTLGLNEDTQLLFSTLYSFHPLASCAALPPSAPSGYYTILPPRGQPTEQVYCDFNRQCGCGGSSAWTRVAFLNMSDPNEVCPSNWETYPSPVRACGNGQTSPNGGCDSVIYPAYGLRYTHVCGHVIGYQHSDTIAFNGFTSGVSSIEQHYLDGVSITHGGAGSRQHIWSFASAFGDAFVAEQPHSSCSCSSSNNWPYSTSFVGNDYFCDTGSHASSDSNTIFASDPLWDGAGCGPSSTCCTFNNPPWFCKTLPQPTTDDLEVRICDSLARRDTPIQLMEIFVQ